MSQTYGKYYPTIGLEIHAELATNTKMFSNAKNDADLSVLPNTNIDPVSLAHPGTLPVPNKEAIRHTIRVGLALGGTIANFTEFDRKNYFYPDIPKGYQISQYKHPIVSGGSLAGIAVTRIHLEEDTGTNKHHGDYSLVDFNRAGVPLMELVTEPVIHSADEAVTFAKELQLILRTLDASYANMDKGEMRVEANISISPEQGKLGTKVEVKNMSSYTMVGKAINYEINRMIDLYEQGKETDIVQETRGWDDDKQQTFSQRKKEDSEGYRYFPEPDIPKLYLHEMFDLEQIREELPELPHEKRARYAHDFGIKTDDIELFLVDRELGVLFENTVIPYANDPALVQLTSNYLTSDIVGLVNTHEQGRALIKNIDPDMLSKLIRMNSDGTLNSRATKDLLVILATTGGDPEHLAHEQGLIQESDPEKLELVVSHILSNHPEQVTAYKAGKESLIKFFVGQAMQATKGSGNPSVLEDLFTQKLKSGD